MIVNIQLQNDIVFGNFRQDKIIIMLKCNLLHKLMKIVLSPWVLFAPLNYVGTSTIIDNHKMIFVFMHHVPYKCYFIAYFMNALYCINMVQM